MQKTYEAPALTIIGQADQVVMGSGSGGFELPQRAPDDFEFEQDQL